MRLNNVARLVKRHALLIGAVTLLGLLGGLGYVLVQVPQYQATNSLFVSIPGWTPTQGVSGEDHPHQQQRLVRSSAELARAPIVLNRVIRDLHLPLTPQQLNDKISTQVGEAVIGVRVSDASPVRAATIANAVGHRLVATVAGLIPAENSEAVRLTQIAPARPPLSPVTPNPPVALTVGLLIGLALGLVVVVLRERGSLRGTVPDEQGAWKP